MTTKHYTILFTLLFCTICGFAQQQRKPTLMILPSDNWCTQRYFMTTFDNQGTRVQVPNYQQAFREDTELGAVVSKIGQLLTNLGYSLKDAEQELRNLAQREAEDNVTFARNSGAFLAESPLDILKRHARADIIIQVGWRVNNEARGRSVTFTLEAFDSYTSKRIATATGTGRASNDIVPVLLENAVRSHIRNFDRQLSQFYTQTLRDGREILLTVRRWSDWSNDLETEFNDKSLLDQIQDWLHKNTVKGQFNLSDATENIARFEQVRIPVTDKNGRAVDARSFAVELQRYLRTAPLNIPSRVMTRGLGEAILVLGEQ
jgi:hypothetical protein